MRSTWSRSLGGLLRWLSLNQRQDPDRPAAAALLFVKTHLSSAQVQQGRDEVMLEFFTDEVGRSEDALMEMSFFVPRDNDRYGGDGENPACKVDFGCQP